MRLQNLLRHRPGRGTGGLAGAQGVDTGPARLVIVDPADAERAASWLRSGGHSPEGWLSGRRRSVVRSPSSTPTERPPMTGWDGISPRRCGPHQHGPGQRSRIRGAWPAHGVRQARLAAHRDRADAVRAAAQRRDRYSFGETVALIALGSGGTPAAHAELFAGSLYTTDMVGSSVRSVRPGVKPGSRATGGPVSWSARTGYGSRRFLPPSLLSTCWWSAHPACS